MPRLFVSSDKGCQIREYQTEAEDADNAVQVQVNHVCLELVNALKIIMVEHLNKIGH